jgi:hypothetical protein
MIRRAIVAHDVFISYASEDKAAADVVCDQLEQKGIRCWIAPRDVMPGIPFAESIIRAINACEVFVILFSAHANKSPHVTNETAVAMNERKKILPFRIENVKPSLSMQYYIGPVHWLDALTPPLELHIDQLAEDIRQLLALDETGEVENDADVEKIDDEVLQVEKEMDNTEGDPTIGDITSAEEDQSGDEQTPPLPGEEQAEESAPEAAKTPLTAANILLEEDAVEEAVIGEVIQIPEAAHGASQELDALPGTDQEDEAAPEVEPQPAVATVAAKEQPWWQRWYIWAGAAGFVLIFFLVAERNRTISPTAEVVEVYATIEEISILSPDTYTARQLTGTSTAFFEVVETETPKSTNTRQPSSTLEPTKTRTPTRTRTPTATEIKSPEQMIISYWELVERGNHSEGWDSLTRNFQQTILSGSYSDYKSWVTTLSECDIRVENLRTINNDGDTAQVTAKVVFYSGPCSRNEYPLNIEFTLKYDHASHQWVLDNSVGL